MRRNHDRSFPWFAQQGPQDRWAGRGEVAVGLAYQGDPVELPSAQEGIHGFRCFEWPGVGRPAHACLYDQMDEGSTSRALSILDLHDQLLPANSLTKPLGLPIGRPQRVVSWLVCMVHVWLVWLDRWSGPG